MVAALNETLTLDLCDQPLWTLRHRYDAAAATLADRHYSREVVGSPQVGGPGRILVLVTPCERAGWISKVHVGDKLPARAAADGFRGYRCTMFRNETDQVASDLIRDAVRVTEDLWGPSPHGWATYVDRTKIKSSNPGYCFKRAGWRRDKTYHHPRLLRFLFP